MKNWLQQCIYFMAGYVMKMNTLVPNINRSGQKDSSFEFRHKAYASRWGQLKKKGQSFE